MKKLLPILALILTHSVCGQIQSPPSSIALQIQSLEKKQDSLRFVMFKIEVESALELLNTQYQNEGIESLETIQKLKRLVNELERTLDNHNRNMGTVNPNSSPTIGNRTASGSFSNLPNPGGGNSQSVTGLESGVSENIGLAGSQWNFGLAGRGMDKGVTPEAGCQIPGTVILNIWVNREGKVIDVEIAAGTTITDSCPIERAIAAARGTKFTPNPNGPQSQKGWIKFFFTY
jgi:TonB family protein